MGLFRHRPSLHTWMRAEPGHPCLRIHPPKTGWNPWDWGSQERRWKHCPVILLYLSFLQSAFALISWWFHSYNQAALCLVFQDWGDSLKDTNDKKMRQQAFKADFSHLHFYKESRTAPFHTSTSRMPTLKLGECLFARANHHNESSP